MSAEEPEDRARYDVLQYTSGEKIACPGCEGALVVEAHEREARQRRVIATAVTGFSLPVAAVIIGLVFFQALQVPLFAGLFFGVASAAIRYITWDSEAKVPELVETNASEPIVNSHIADFDPDKVASVEK